MAKKFSTPIDDRETLETMEKAILLKLINGEVLTLEKLYKHGFRLDDGPTCDHRDRDILITLLDHGLLTLDQLQKMRFRIDVGEVVNLRLSRNERKILTMMGIIVHPDRGAEERLEFDTDAKVVEIEMLTVYSQASRLAEGHTIDGLRTFVRIAARKIKRLDVN